MSSELLKVKKEKTLPDERYDEKLFKQAYKAALDAKELEKKNTKRKKLLRIVYIILGISVIPFLFFIYQTFKPTYFEYIESENLPYKSQFSDFKEEPFENEPTLSVKVPTISAMSAIVFDPDSGEVLYKKDEDEQRSIASLTKLISVLVVLDTFELEDTALVSTENIPEDLDWQLELNDGFSITVQDLLEAMVISSYNDAAYVIANAYPYGGYDGFINAMNTKAKTLGMENSKFSNPAGLDDPDNYSTANDVAKLVSAVINRHEVLDIAKKGAAVVSWKDSKGKMSSKTIYTTNQLYGTSTYIQGLKTGITKEALQCFAGYFTYPSKRRVVTVVLGSEDRFKDTQILESTVRVVLK